MKDKLLKKAIEEIDCIINDTNTSQEDIQEFVNEYLQDWYNKLIINKYHCNECYSNKNSEEGCFTNDPNKLNFIPTCLEGIWDEEIKPNFKIVENKKQ